MPCYAQVLALGPVGNTYVLCVCDRLLDGIYLSPKELFSRLTVHFVPNNKNAIALNAILCTMSDLGVKFYIIILAIIKIRL
jgi:hypothetical protein